MLEASLMNDNKKFLSFPSPSRKQTKHRDTEGIMRESSNDHVSLSILLNLTSLLTQIQDKSNISREK